MISSSQIIHCPELLIILVPAHDAVLQLRLESIHKLYWMQCLSNELFLNSTKPKIWAADAEEGDLEVYKANR